MKPTIKNLAAYSGKGTATIQRWKKDKSPLYEIIKKDFMNKYNPRAETK
jgi:uncharacterized protein YhfF